MKARELGDNALDRAQPSVPGAGTDWLSTETAGSDCGDPPLDKSRSSATARSVPSNGAGG